MSSTSLFKAERTKSAESVDGVCVVVEGGTYPFKSFAGVMEPGGSKPCALSAANKSRPGAGAGAANIEERGLGVDCGCGKDTWGAGGVAGVRCALAMMSARFFESREACKPPVCGCRAGVGR